MGREGERRGREGKGGEGINEREGEEGGERGEGEGRDGEGGEIGPPDFLTSLRLCTSKTTPVKKLAVGLLSLI